MTRTQPQTCGYVGGCRGGVDSRTTAIQSVPVLSCGRLQDYNEFIRSWVKDSPSTFFGRVQSLPVVCVFVRVCVYDPTTQSDCRQPIREQCLVM